jgi:hypothetical protein
MAYPFDGHAWEGSPLTDSPLIPPRGGWCHLQTRHNYEISYPYEWGERLDGTPRVRVESLGGFCPSTTVPLTRYVRRVRELRQNVRLPFPFLHLPPDSDPTVRPLLVLYHISRDICRYGRFSKSIRPDEVGACQFASVSPHPLFRLSRARHTSHIILCLVPQKDCLNEDR